MSVPTKVSKGTDNTLNLDYLRQNLKVRLEEPVINFLNLKRFVSLQSS